MTFGERLTRALKSAGYTQTDLARAIGVKPQAIQYLCKQNAQWSRHTHDIARVLGINPDWLSQGIGEMKPQGQRHMSVGDTRPIVTWETPDDLSDHDYVLVNRVDVRPSAGEGALVFQEEEGPPLAFSAQWIKERGLKRRNLLTVKAQGDSMEPTIYDGDVIMLDSGFEQVVDGQVYVLRYGDDLKVKRLFQRYDGSLIIRSDNEQKYPPETVPAEANGRVAVIGRVVWRAGGVN